MYMQYIKHSNCYRCHNLSSKCLQYPCQQLGDTTSLCKVNSHMLNDDQRAKCLLLTTTHVQHWRNEGNALLHHILTTDESWMDSFDPKMKWQNGTLQTSSRKKLHTTVGVLWKSYTSCSSAEIDLCLTILCQLVPQLMVNITVHSCKIMVRPALHCKQLELLQCDVILLWNKATTPCYHELRNLVQCWGWAILAHPPYSTDLVPCDYWLFACEGTSLGKTIWVGRQHQHCCHWLFTLSEQGWTHLQMIIYHADAKSVCTSPVITLSRGHMYKHSRISLM